jgi:dTDP-4-dehydrorhamnose reductase
MRLLIIGGSGLLGYKVVELAAKKHETFFTYNYRAARVEGATSIKLDKADRAEAFETVKNVRPEVIIDTAALHNVDYCETHREEARKINVEGTRNIVEACRQANAKMIFLSTDYVFDGTKGYYSEEDHPSPVNFYAKTKLEAENLVKNAETSYCIARPSVIYGWNPSEAAGLKSSSGKSVNFVLWALAKLRNSEGIKAVTDQYSSPTLADDLADVLLRMAASPKNGTYHTAGKSCINRYDFTLKIAETFGFNSSLVSPTTSDSFKQVADRPKRCCLNVTKAEQAFEKKFMTAEEGLAMMKHQSKEMGL